MRASVCHLLALMIAAFSNILAAQEMPEITAPATLTTSENQTWGITPPLMPGDEGYLDESSIARLAKRTPPAGAYMCDSVNWAGKCKWTPAQDYQCMPFPNDASSSFGAPQGWQCKIFWGKGCQIGTGTDGKLTYPGTGNVGQLYRKADHPSSYMCRMCNDVPGADPNCANNKAPDFNFAQAKYGYGGLKNMCSYWSGLTHWSTTCMATATIDLHFPQH